MSTLINPTITIIEANKNKNFKYYTAIDRSDTTLIKIKARDFSGESRGIVGEITRNGSIKAERAVMKHITPQVKEKINLLVSLIYTSDNAPTMKNGLINFEKSIR